MSTARSIKQTLHDLADSLPADATLDEAMEMLSLLAKIQRGLEQADAGDVIPHEEVRKRFPE